VWQVWEGVLLVHQQAWFGKAYGCAYVAANGIGDGAFVGRHSGESLGDRCGLSCDLFQGDVVVNWILLLGMFAFKPCILLQGYAAIQHMKGRKHRCLKELDCASCT